MCLFKLDGPSRMRWAFSHLKGRTSELHIEISHKRSGINVEDNSNLGLVMVLLKGKN